MTSSEFPASSAPTLTLVHPTEEEKLQTWKLNGKSWAGRLSMETYIKRETFLANQAFTRDGGITYWILVDSTKSMKERAILASCESLRKRALVARAEKDGAGEVEEVVSHGIGSVFCNPEYRGRGYARRMVEELARTLDTWQQPDGKRTDFTVLYSDIGKVCETISVGEPWSKKDSQMALHGKPLMNADLSQKFYSQAGWEPFTSSHVLLPPILNDDFTGGLKSRPLLEGDLKKLCMIDEASVIKKGLVQQSAKAGKTMVSLIPDWETMQWHHAREEFAAKELLGGRVPEVKGAYIQCEDKSRVWCIWSRFFGNDSNDSNILNILRLVVEGDEELSVGDSETVENGSANGDSNSEKVQAIASLLRAAQAEAAKWDMKNVQVWNPTRLAMRAAQSIEPSTKVIHRDEESIASLRWHHGEGEAANIEWLGNEKYGWC